MLDGLCGVLLVWVLMEMWLGGVLMVNVVEVGCCWRCGWLGC
jgi:hypothetical protein